MQEQTERTVRVDLIIDERNRMLLMIAGIAGVAIAIILIVFTLKLNELEKIKVRTHTLNALMDKDIEGRVNNLVKDELYKIDSIKTISKKFDKKVVTEDISTIYSAMRRINGEPELSKDGLTSIVQKIQKEINEDYDFETGWSHE